WILRNEMIRQYLQPRCELHAQFVHASQMIQLPHRTGHISKHDIRKTPFGESFRSPKIPNQGASLLRNFPPRPNGDAAIVDELSGLNVQRAKTAEQNRAEKCVKRVTLFTCAG